jgi:ABC-type transport system involved in multi-copper enzyme maturation permease subunit
MVAQLFWNPIVAKEYRSRMRTWRSPLAMTAYIVLLGGIGWAVFSSMVSSAQYNYGPGQAANYGQQLFSFLILFQMLLLAFITPALTAGAISGERERQTMDLLFVTRVPPFSILWGKLLASMSFVLLLLLLSVPIFSLVFLFGGIELDQMLAAFLVTGVTGLTLGALGLFFSTISRRTLPSTVAAYGAAFVLCFGTLLFAYLFPTKWDPNATRLPAPPAISYLSPITPLTAITSNQPITPGFGVTQAGYGNSGGGMVCQGGPGGQICKSVAVPAGKGRPVPMGGPYSISSTTAGAIPSGLFSGWQYWQASVVMQLIVCVGALALSAFLLPPLRRFGKRRTTPVLVTPNA